MLHETREGQRKMKVTLGAAQRPILSPGVWKPP